MSNSNVQTRSLSLLLSIALAFIPVAGCNSAESPTSPTPEPTLGPSAPLPPVVTFEPDTLTPVGQAVALTYGSRSQEPGKIVVAVTGFNLRNEISPTVNGVSAARGRLKWDDALLEIDGVGVGDLFGGNSAGNVDNGGWPEMPGTFPFAVRRNDQARVTGSGELVLLRLRPRTGITAGTTRIELEPFLANEGGPFPFMTPLLLFPYQPPRGNQIENAYGGSIEIRPAG
jgi:hypothetical protein